MTVGGHKKTLRNISLVGLVDLIEGLTLKFKCGLRRGCLRSMPRLFVNCMRMSCLNFLVVQRVVCFVFVVFWIELVFVGWCIKFCNYTHAMKRISMLFRVLLLSRIFSHFIGLLGS